MVHLPLSVDLMLEAMETLLPQDDASGDLLTDPTIRSVASSSSGNTHSKRATRGRRGRKPSQAPKGEEGGKEGALLARDTALLSDK